MIANVHAGKYTQYNWVKAYFYKLVSDLIFKFDLPFFFKYKLKNYTVINISVK